ncbi:MAG: AAA family ATPase [Woeseiaceae bacterium]|nr:AAA family ATPase [Woeseiaceae bacterium]
MDREDVDLEPIEREKALVKSLSHGRAYDHAVKDIRVLDTHISWVVLTGDFAYKIKKPIKLAFLDYSTLEKRRHYCELELELNRRWAPELYLDVVPICGSFESPVVDGPGTPIEYAVRMKQFPQSAQLDAQLAAGSLVNRDMVDLAETVAEIHAVIPAYEALSGDAFSESIGQAMLDNFEYLQECDDNDDVANLLSWTRQSLDDCRQLIVARYESGFVRECHGDLHLRNLVRLPSGVTPYDCVEFSVELRNIDVISDVSFLVMDLVARGEERLAYAFINRYLERSGDYAGVAVLGLYVVYHALIRAKIAVIRAIERTRESMRRHDRQETAHYLAVARRWVGAGPPRLVIMHGFSGSGKTWLSRQLMLRLPAIRVRSDLERKRMHGLRETERSGAAPGQGLYGPDVSAGVYERLADIAGTILTARHNVIVDAAFLNRTERDRFRDLAGRAGSAFAIVSARAAQDELHRRVEDRHRHGRDPSEADVAVLRYEFDHADGLGADERDRVIEVATDRPVDIDRVCESLH